MAAVFVCTIGPGMETWAKRVSGEEPVFGYIADTVASLAAENLSNALHDRIGAAAAARGWKATNRYSPGYCDWPVSDQHLVFSLLPDGFCGITLTDSALMIPVKSVSGIIGVGPGVRRLEYSCDRCGMKDCTYRSVRSRRSTVGSRRKGVITPKGNAT